MNKYYVSYHLKTKNYQKVEAAAISTKLVPDSKNLKTFFYEIQTEIQKIEPEEIIVFLVLGWNYIV